MTLEHKNTSCELLAQTLSAGMDGELSQTQAQALFQQVAQDAEAVKTWQTYHLIGDVLRSSDLARPHDEAFMVHLRAALREEPVVLAPRAAVPQVHADGEMRALRRWRAPAAAVAGVGVVLVAGTLWRSVPSPAHPGSDLTLERLTPARTVATASAAVEGATPPPQWIRDAQDAQLDRYMSAHKQFSGATALGEPSGVFKASLTDADLR